MIVKFERQALNTTDYACEYVSQLMRVKSWDRARFKRDRGLYHSEKHMGKKLIHVARKSSFTERYAEHSRAKVILVRCIFL
jgi:hypothetical protein